MIFDLIIRRLFTIALILVILAFEISTNLDINNKAAIILIIFVTIIDFIWIIIIDAAKDWW